MKGTMKKFLAATLTIAASITGSAYAESPTIVCPTLTANDIENVISNGHIGTRQGYTLADEAGLSRAQVIIEEPTANPFDTFYSMGIEKDVNNQQFGVFLGNILGKTVSEAKERARKIFADEKTLDGKYDSEKQICVYKEFDASPSIANYPFKSTYETVFLVAVPFLTHDDSANLMRHFNTRKHRG